VTPRKTSPLAPRSDSSPGLSLHAFPALCTRPHSGHAPLTPCSAREHRQSGLLLHATIVYLRSAVSPQYSPHVRPKPSDFELGMRHEPMEPRESAGRMARLFPLSWTVRGSGKRVEGVRGRREKKLGALWVVSCLPRIEVV
jgi:hypothetical protein